MNRFISIIATAAAAALALLGLGAAPAAAETGQATATQVQAPMLSEVLIDTIQRGWIVDGFEIVKPAGKSLDGYRVQKCTTTSKDPTTIITFGSDTAWLDRISVANVSGWDYGFSGNLDRDGGLRLVDGTTVVDAVTFNPTNDNVTACLGGNPEISPAPTAIMSAQRLCDTGPWGLAEPTLGSTNYCA